MFNFNKLNKISGAQVIGMLHAGEYVFDKRGCKHYFKEGEGSTLYVDMQGVEIPSQATYNSVINGEWYTDHTFDVRKELISRPDEWVAKYYNEINQACYVGFDSEAMLPVESVNIASKVKYNPSTYTLYTPSESLNKAVPLDKEDLRVLITLKSK